MCNCQAQEPGMSKATKHRIVQETGDQYKVLQQQEVTGKDGRYSNKPQPAKVQGESWSDAMREQHAVVASSSSSVEVE